MKLFTSFGRSTRQLAFVVSLLSAFIPLSASAQYSRVTEAEVNASVQTDNPAWTEKINQLGRPRLLYSKEGLEHLRARLMTAPLQPETLSLLGAARELAARGPRPYTSPEEFVAKGQPAFAASGEEWIRIAGDELVVLAVAASLQPSPALEKALHDSVLAVCRYPTWGRKGAAPEDNMDLACAHVARGVALAWDWFPGLWTPADKDLITEVISTRVGQLMKGLYGAGFWASSYLDNHNHVNMCAVGWAGVAFHGDIPQAPAWLAAARRNFQHVATYFPADGSSHEGVDYWAYGISFILQYIEGTRLILDSASLYKAPFLQNAAAYRLNASTSGLKSVLPWGDSFGNLENGYVRPLISRIAAENQDPAAAWLARQFPVPKMESGDMVVWSALWQPPSGRSPLLELDYHLPVADHVSTRSGWGLGDYLLAIKSGWNNRNHSHLDAGSLALAFGTDWLLTAPGYGKGKSSGDFWDFRSKRWRFFSNATESHTTLLINGENQRSDSKARGTIDRFLGTPLWSYTSIDLTQAYKAVASVRRDVLHRRNDYILVFDAASAKPAPAAAANTEPASPPVMKVEWLAQLPATPEFTDGGLLVKSDSGSLRLRMLAPQTEFASRKPTSPIVDIPGAFSKRGIFSYSVASSGESVNMIALLQPVFAGADTAPLVAETSTDASGLTRVRVTGPNWTDHVLRSVGTAELETDGIRATAIGLVVRVTPGSAPGSFLAVQAKRVEFSGIVITPDAPAEIGWEQTPDGAWLVDSNRNLEGLVTAPNRSIRRMELSGKTHWLIGQGTFSEERTHAWLSSFVKFREKAPLPVKALAAQKPLSAATTVPVVVEAESFSRQDYGKAESVGGKPGASGKSVRGFGNNAPDNSLIWDFEIAQAGQYKLAIRYATTKTDVTASLLVDGSLPDSSLAKVPFPPTGGWSISADDWKNLTVTDGQGSDFIFNLSAGKHTLTLARPTDALALDRFEFIGTGAP